MRRTGVGVDVRARGEMSVMRTVGVRMVMRSIEHDVPVQAEPLSQQETQADNHVERLTASKLKMRRNTHARLVAQIASAANRKVRMGRAVSTAIEPFATEQPTEFFSSDSCWRIAYPDDC